MKTRSWVRLFVSTLLIGGGSTLLIGIFLKWNEFTLHFGVSDVKAIGTLILWLIGIGFTFSAVSQMGFFAYLTIHQFGLGMFRSTRLWNSVQILLMCFIIVDLLFLRTVSGKGTSSLLYDSCFVLLILAVGWIVAKRKSIETKKETFIPALFFMVFVTILEWLPAVRVGDYSWMTLMLLTLLICNAYQLLVLHRITIRDTSHDMKSA